ncbi:hypothetical protein LTR37_000250 [Vermiconidia calcicola]|uniref:Uncharacterized protein n=1 Tax=Vermiconidia calcicola TaxID=1690605 RepID=A0ACC3NZH6_9PEZI|nr:hypothetical protein LTR37_000250 [Vermiconidia calcicola]
MTSISKLTNLVQKQRAKDVQMNESKILLYRPGAGIVTQDLGSCHVIVLQSPIAVLLSHISPRASRDQPAHISGDQYVSGKVDEALQLYLQWRSWFPEGSSAWGIYAWYDGKIALGDQKRIIEQKLGRTGLPVFDKYYDVPMIYDKPGRGTVVCGWMDDDRICRLYVEDKVQNDIAVQRAHVQLASSLASAQKKAEAGQSASTAGTQAPGPQASITRSPGAAAWTAAIAVLQSFGIDNARAKVSLQKRLQDAQAAKNFSGDTNQAALTAACQTVIDKSPKKLTLSQAQELLRRQMAAQSSNTAGGAGPSRTY